MRRNKQRGFSLIELMVAMAVLLVVVGAILMLISQSQQRYASTTTIEEATAMVRDAMDQVVREIRLAGYPPANGFPCDPPFPPGTPPPGAAYGACLTAANSGFVAGGILIGGDYSVRFEADTDGNGLVEVFDYELRVPPGGAALGGCAALTVDNALTTPTLLRRVAEKNAAGIIPAAELQPFLENVRNCELGEPIFLYCPAPPDPPNTPPAECPTMSNYLDSSLGAPQNTRVVLVRLQVEARLRDPQTGAFQNIEQFGIAERVNPD